MSLENCLELLIKATKKELEDMLGVNYIKPDYTIKKIGDLEQIMFTALGSEMKRVKGDISSVKVKDLLNYVKGSFLPSMALIDDLSKEMEKFLNKTILELSNEYMKQFDNDLMIDKLSKSATDHIKGWSVELAALMHGTSAKGLERIFGKGIKEGLSIQKIGQSLQNEFLFSRERARRAAITEVLTAHSVAKDEVAIQHPAVTGKEWKHSGGRGIHPRPHHVALDGKKIKVGDKYTINSPKGQYKAKYPRDTILPAGERVSCHCTETLITDKKIFGLSREEKQKLQSKIIEREGL